MSDQYLYDANNYVNQQRAALGIQNYTPQQLQQDASTYMQGQMGQGQVTNVNGVEGLMNQGGQPVAYQSVDPNALVSDQLNGLLDQNSPYVNSAYAAGLRQAASSGMLNSGMASGEAYNAAVQSALPIAQGNATEYANVNAANQNAVNQYNTARLQANTQAGAAGLSYAGNLQSAQLSADTQQMDAGLGYASQMGSASMQSNAQITASMNMAGGQVEAAKTYANAQLQGQQIQAQLTKEQMAQQAQQFGQTLNWNETSFGQQMAQQNQQFAANYGLNEQQLTNQSNQYFAGLNYNWDVNQENLSHQDWTTGVNLQASSLQDYSNALNGMMQNPNMTASDRSAAISNLQSIFNGFSQQFANIPTWKNPYGGGTPYTMDPSYWSGGYNLNQNTGTVGTVGT